MTKDLSVRSFNRKDKDFFFDNQSDERFLVGFQYIPIIVLANPDRICSTLFRNISQKYLHVHMSMKASNRFTQEKKCSKKRKTSLSKSFSFPCFFHVYFEFILMAGKSSRYTLLMTCTHTHKEDQLMCPLPPPLLYCHAIEYEKKCKTGIFWLIEY